MIKCKSSLLRRLSRAIIILSPKSFISALKVDFLVLFADRLGNIVGFPPRSNEGISGAPFAFYKSHLTAAMCYRGKLAFQLKVGNHGHGGRALFLVSFPMHPRRPHLGCSLRWLPLRYPPIHACTPTNFYKLPHFNTLGLPAFLAQHLLHARTVVPYALTWQLCFILAFHPCFSPFPSTILIPSIRKFCGGACGKYLYLFAPLSDPITPIPPLSRHHWKSAFARLKHSLSVLFRSSHSRSILTPPLSCFPRCFRVS